jgi:hypothetical protein
MPIRDLLDEERANGDGLVEVKDPRPLKQSDFLSVLSTARTSKTAAYEYQHNRRSAVGGSSDEREDTSVTDLLKLLAAFGAASSAANNR